MLPCYFTCHSKIGLVAADVIPVSEWSHEQHHHDHAVVCSLGLGGWDARVGRGYDETYAAGPESFRRLIFAVAAGYPAVVDVLLAKSKKKNKGDEGIKGLGKREEMAQESTCWKRSSQARTAGRALDC